jgi:hypothetical protein
MCRSKVVAIPVTVSLIIVVSITVSVDLKDNLASSLPPPGLDLPEPHPQPTAPPPDRSSPASEAHLHDESAPSYLPAPLDVGVPNPAPPMHRTLSVHVLDQWDRPVHATVIARPDRAQLATAHVTTAADGIASITIAPGVPYQLEARPLDPSFAPASVTPSVYAESREVIIRLRSRHARITASIVDPHTGTPVAPAALTVKSINGKKTHPVPSDGRIDLRLPSGDIDLLAVALLRTPCTRSFHLSAGDWEHTEMPLPQLPRLTLYGSVCDSVGKPVPDAEIVLQFLDPSWPAGGPGHFPVPLGKQLSGDDGRFVFREIPAGDLAVGVLAVGYEPLAGSTFHVERSEATIGIVLARAGRLRLSLAAGTVRPGMTLELHRDGNLVITGIYLWELMLDRLVGVSRLDPGVTCGPAGRWTVAKEQSSLDEAGSFLIDGVLPGNYVILVHAPSGRLIARARADVCAGETATVRLESVN